MAKVRFATTYLVFICCTLFLNYMLWADQACAEKQVKGKPLIVVHSNDTPPLSFYGLNGEPKGLVFDYWQAWSRANGVPVKFVLTDWPTTLKMVRDGQADIHGGLYYNEERDAFLDYSDPYFDLEAALFVREALGVGSIEELGQRPVAVLDKGFSEFYLRENYPNLRLKPYKTSRHMVDAALAGEVDAMLTEFTTLVHQLGSRAKTNEFKPIATLYSHSLRAAVAEGNTKLLSIVREGEDNLSSKDRERVFSRWFIIESPYPAWLFPGIALGIFIVVGLVFFLSGQRRNK